nr:putative fatty acyl-CoA reductase CG8306 [Onthophagus taurus]XP_022920421.1 putative fatty acyl-CoA reductase CG8306 [Onthophagus taurus]
MSVRDFYSKKNVFITGGTGFLGICLIEKLLRTIPDIGDIYLLLRPKKGKEISERLEEISKNKIFEKLLESQDATIFSKLKAISGDVGQIDLGISESDREILTEKVNVIFHSAATLDFAETLKATIDINLLGTRRVLELAKKCRNLSVYIHVSSAYVNSWKLSADEVLYPLEQSAEKFIELAETVSAEKLEEMTPELLGNHPNTYTITKHMAEFEVKKMEEVFPCTIVRPSMIVGAWKEPIPGWTISKNGPQGFIMGASKGVVRRLPVGKDLIYDYIPVDVVVNELIVAGYFAGENKSKSVEIYHCTSSTRQPFRWATVEDRVNGLLHKYPLKSAVWYPHLKFLPNLTWFKISAIFVHFLPAIILDTVTKIFGGRPILMRLHRNVNASLNRLEKFIFTEWAFKADRTSTLHQWLNPADQRDFGLDLKELYWPDYFNDLTKGARIYLSKEPMRNLAAAKGKDTLLMVLHLTLQAGILSIIWYIFACLVGTTMTKSAFIVPIFYILSNFL